MLRTSGFGLRGPQPPASAFSSSVECSSCRRTAPSVGEYPFSFSEKDSRRRWIQRPKSLNPSIFQSRSLSGSMNSPYHPSKCNLSIFPSFNLSIFRLSLPNSQLTQQNGILYPSISRFIPNFRSNGGFRIFTVDGE